MQDTQELLGRYIIVSKERNALHTNCYRVLDVKTNVCNISSEEKIVAAINKGATFRNATVANNNLKGINGSLERYPYSDEPVKRIIIISQTIKDGVCVSYRFADNHGTVFEFSVKKVLGIIGELLKRGVDYPICNGKLVDGHISAIMGTYEKIDFEPNLLDNTELETQDIITNKEQNDITKQSLDIKLKNLAYNIARDLTLKLGYTIEVKQLHLFEPFKGCTDGQKLMSRLKKLTENGTVPVHLVYEGYWKVLK